VTVGNHSIGKYSSKSTVGDAVVSACHEFVRELSFHCWIRNE
jgi:hypothetical protein